MQRLGELLSSPRARRRTLRRLNWEYLLIPVVLAAVLLLWELLVRLRQYPTFLLPTPRRVATRFLIAWRDGSLWLHTWVTLKEVFGGLALGLSVALVLGYLLANPQE